MSSVRPGNQGRGWNDPPEFLHNNENITNTVTNERSILNKRVAHNINTINAPPSSNTPTQPVPSTGPLPPLPISDQQLPASLPSTTPSAPPVIKSTINTDEASQSTENPSVMEEQLTVESIEQILTEKVNHLKESSISTKITDEIVKRIKIFVTNWEKLSNVPKSRMSDLANALKINELKKADDLHVRLMLDYPSEVIQWMVGVKKLIYELRELETKTN